MSQMIDKNGFPVKKGTQRVKSPKKVNIAKDGYMTGREMQMINNLNFNPETDVPQDFGQALLKGAFESTARRAPDFDPRTKKGLVMMNDGSAWGDSMFDQTDGTIMPSLDPGDLQDARAENQGWLSELAAGLGKTGTKAASAFAQGITAVGQAAYWGFDRIAGTMSDDFGNFSFTDNDLTRMYYDLDQYFEKIMPNYRSRAEENMNLWETMGTMNFWADSVLKNAGYTVASLYTGNVFGSVASGLSIGAGLVKAGSAIGKGLGILSATAAESATAARVAAGINTLTTGLMSALGEAQLEGHNAGVDFEQGAMADLDRKRYEDIMKIEQLFADKPDDQATFLEKQKLIDEVNASYAAGVQEVRNQSKSVMSWTAGLNIPVVTMSNMLMFGRAWAGGFNQGGSVGAVRALGKSIHDGYEVFYNPIRKTITGSIKNALSEGLWEEGTQGFVSHLTADSSLDDVQNAYIKRYNSSNLLSAAGMDSRAEAEVENMMTSFFDTAKNYYTSKAGLEEIMVGAIMGIAGAPHVHRKTNSTTGKKEWAFNMAGGFIDEYKEHKQRKERADYVVNYINNRAKDSDKFKATYEGLVRHKFFQKSMEQAIEQSDEESYLESEYGQMLSDIAMFRDMGKESDFMKYLEHMTDMSDEEVKGLITNTSTAKESNAEDNLNNMQVSPFADLGIASFTNPTDEDVRKVRERINENSKRLKEMAGTFRKKIFEADVKTNSTMTPDQLSDVAYATMKSEFLRERLKSIQENDIDALKNATIDQLKARREQLVKESKKRTVEYEVVDVEESLVPTLDPSARVIATHQDWNNAQSNGGTLNKDEMLAKAKTGGEAGFFSRLSGEGHTVSLDLQDSHTTTPVGQGKVRVAQPKSGQIATSKESQENENLELKRVDELINNLDLLMKSVGYKGSIWDTITGKKAKIKRAQKDRLNEKEIDELLDLIIDSNKISDNTHRDYLRLQLNKMATLRQKIDLADSVYLDTISNPEMYRSAIDAQRKARRAHKVNSLAEDIVKSLNGVTNPSVVLRRIGERTPPELEDEVLEAIMQMDGYKALRDEYNNRKEVEALEKRITDSFNEFIEYKASQLGLEGKKKIDALRKKATEIFGFFDGNDQTSILYQLRNAGNSLTEAEKKQLAGKLGAHFRLLKDGLGLRKDLKLEDLTEEMVAKALEDLTIENERDVDRFYDIFSDGRTLNEYIKQLNNAFDEGKRGQALYDYINEVFQGTYQILNNGGKSNKIREKYDIELIAEFSKLMSDTASHEAFLNDLESSRLANPNFHSMSRKASSEFDFYQDESRSISEYFNQMYSLEYPVSIRVEHGVTRQDITKELEEALVELFKANRRKENESLRSKDPKSVHRHLYVISPSNLKRGKRATFTELIDSKKSITAGNIGIDLDVSEFVIPISIPAGSTEILGVPNVVTRYRYEYAPAVLNKLVSKKLPNGGNPWSGDDSRIDSKNNNRGNNNQGGDPQPPTGGAPSNQNPGQPGPTNGQPQGEQPGGNNGSNPQSNGGNGNQDQGNPQGGTQTPQNQSGQGSGTNNQGGPQGGNSGQGNALSGSSGSQSPGSQGGNGKKNKGNGGKNNRQGQTKKEKDDLKKAISEVDSFADSIGREFLDRVDLGEENDDWKTYWKTALKSFVDQAKKMDNNGRDLKFGGISINGNSNDESILEAKRAVAMAILASYLTRFHAINQLNIPFGDKLPNLSTYPGFTFSLNKDTGEVSFSIDTQISGNTTAFLERALGGSGLMQPVIEYISSTLKAAIGTDNDSYFYITADDLVKALFGEELGGLYPFNGDQEISPSITKTTLLIDALNSFGEDVRNLVGAIANALVMSESARLVSNSLDDHTKVPHGSSSNSFSAFSINLNRNESQQSSIGMIMVTTQPLHGNGREATPVSTIAETSLAHAEDILSPVFANRSVRVKRNLDGSTVTPSSTPREGTPIEAVIPKTENPGDDGGGNNPKGRKKNKPNPKQTNGTPPVVNNHVVISALRDIYERSGSRDGFKRTMSSIISTAFDLSQYNTLDDFHKAIESLAIKRDDLYPIVSVLSRNNNLEDFISEVKSIPNIGELSSDDETNLELLYNSFYNANGIPFLFSSEIEEDVESHFNSAIDPIDVNNKSRDERLDTAISVDSESEVERVQNGAGNSLLTSGGTRQFIRSVSTKYTTKSLANEGRETPLVENGYPTSRFLEDIGAYAAVEQGLVRKVFDQYKRGGQSSKDVPIHVISIPASRMSTYFKDSGTEMKDSDRMYMAIEVSNRIANNLPNNIHPEVIDGKTYVIVGRLGTTSDAKNNEATEFFENSLKAMRSQEQSRTDEERQSSFIVDSGKLYLYGIMNGRIKRAFDENGNPIQVPITKEYLKGEPLVFSIKQADGVFEFVSPEGVNDMNFIPTGTNNKIGSVFVYHQKADGNYYPHAVRTKTTMEVSKTSDAMNAIRKAFDAVLSEGEDLSKKRDAYRELSRYLVIPRKFLHVSKQEVRIGDDIINRSSLSNKEVVDKIIDIITEKYPIRFNMSASMDENQMNIYLKDGIIMTNVESIENVDSTILASVAESGRREAGILPGKDEIGNKEKATRDQETLLGNGNEVRRTFSKVIHLTQNGAPVSFNVTYDVVLKKNPTGDVIIDRVIVYDRSKGDESVLRSGDPMYHVFSTSYLLYENPNAIDKRARVTINGQESFLLNLKDFNKVVTPGSIKSASKGEVALFSGNQIHLDLENIQALLMDSGIINLTSVGKISEGNGSNGNTTRNYDYSRSYLSRGYEAYSKNEDTKGLLTEEQLEKLRRMDKLDEALRTKGPNSIEDAIKYGVNGFSLDDIRSFLALSAFGSLLKIAANESGDYPILDDLLVTTQLGSNLGIEERDVLDDLFSNHMGGDSYPIYKENESRSKFLKSDTYNSIIDDFIPKNDYGVYGGDTLGVAAGVAFANRLINQVLGKTQIGTTGDRVTTILNPNTEAERVGSSIGAILAESIARQCG